MPPNRHHTAWLPFAHSRLESFSSSLLNIPAQEGCFCSSWQEGLCPGRRQQEWLGLSQPGNDSTVTALSVQIVLVLWMWHLSRLSGDDRCLPAPGTNNTALWRWQKQPQPNQSREVPISGNTQKNSVGVQDYHTPAPLKKACSHYETLESEGDSRKQCGAWVASFINRWAAHSRDNICPGIKVVPPHPQQHKYLDTVNPPSMGNISWGGWANLGCVIILSQL